MGKALHWIRVDVSTPDHPKVRRLERALGDAALAYLVRLWTWAARFAPDGDLSGYEWEEIETAARWPGEPGRLVDELTRCGFLDDDDSGASLHGWQERQSDAASRRAATAERQRRFRRRHAEGPASVTQEAAQRHAEDVTHVTPGREASNAAAVTPVTPLHVTPTYERTDERTNSRESRRAGARDAEPPEAARGEPGEVTLLPYLDALAALHPRFGLENDVARALQRQAANLPLLGEFVEALQRHAATDEWRDGYAPAAARWVDGAGWKSPPPPARRRRDAGEVVRFGESGGVSPLGRELRDRVANALRPSLEAGIVPADAFEDALGRALRAPSAEAADAIVAATLALGPAEVAS